MSNTKLPELVGVLWALPDSTKRAVEAYGQACAAIAAKRPAPCEHACESKAFEIEIQQLKARASTADQLQVRLGEMAAEIDRLNAEREQLLAQEPIYQMYSESRGWVDLCEQSYANNTRAGHKTRTVYARPIPAQQSPAVAVPDEIPRDDYADSESKAHRRGWNDCREEMLRNIATPSSRITEQELIEIAKSYKDLNRIGHCTEANLKCWMNAYGRALLEKLNKPDSVGV